MNLNQSSYAIVSHKIECDFGNWPLCDINERIIEATSNFQGALAKYDSVLYIEEIVKIYANLRWF